MEQLKEDTKLKILTKLLESTFLQALTDMERSEKVEGNHHERPAV